MAEQHKLSFLARDLEERKSSNRLRRLNSYTPSRQGAVIHRGDRKLINFCSNDYLGLSGHPKLVEQAKAYTDSHGTGAAASRMITGTYDIHIRLEEKLAAALKTESALLFNSGFQANSTIVGTLAGRHSLVLADKRSHNSLLQGGLLSRATLQRFDHNNLEHLKQLLEKGIDDSYKKIIIITESVFSMDGDRADIAAIAELGDRYNAILFVDDAHAVGVWGTDGWGMGSEVPGVDLVLGTCGKALGAFGAFVGCSSVMKEYLVNYCPGFIYTTALPPPVVGAIDAAVDLVPRMKKEREQLHRNSAYMREQLQQLGFNTGSSTSQIIPIIIGEEEKTLSLSNWLYKHELLATAIRPPTVTEGSSRIRVTLSAAHRREDIDYFLEILEGWNYE